MAHIKAVHHIGVFTADMERSLRFYRDGLGGEIVHHFEIPGGTINMVGIGDAVVELVPMTPSTTSGAPAGGLAHFALTVDDTRAMYETAIAAGAKPGMMTPVELPLGTRKAVLAYVIGPDSETIEFYQPL
jgi:catechol 2,3-dioxygenase-like lactoylglutathione lyase family enzyme